MTLEQRYIAWSCHGQQSQSRCIPGVARYLVLQLSLSVATLQLLQHVVRVTTLQRELHQVKAAAANGGHQHQQPNLVSLDSWSQSGADTNSTWDAFSNQPQGPSQPASQLGHPAAAPQPSPLSPLSPQRQAATARAQAFIKTQTSNVQSMQVL